MFTETDCNACSEDNTFRERKGKGHNHFTCRSPDSFSKHCDSKAVHPWGLVEEVVSKLKCYLPLEHLSLPPGIPWAETVGEEVRCCSTPFSVIISLKQRKEI